MNIESFRDARNETSPTDEERKEAIEKGNGLKEQKCFLNRIQ